MMILIIGFICPRTIQFITKCDKCYYKVRSSFTKKCDSFFNIKKCDKCYNKLQSAIGITNCDDKLQSATELLHVAGTCCYVSEYSSLLAIAVWLLFSLLHFYFVECILLLIY